MDHRPFLSLSCNSPLFHATLRRAATLAQTDSVMFVMSIPSKNAFQDAANAYRTGRLGEAEALCRHLLEVDSSRPDVISLLEKVLSAQGRTAEIIPLYRNALTLTHHIIEARSTYGGLRRLKALGFTPENMLDIGAYEGEWMRMAKAVFPQSRVLMVEAQPEKDPVLKAACHAFDGSVEYAIALLGRDNREAAPFYQMRTPSGSTGSSLYEEQTSFERRVVTLPMRRLDDLLPTHTKRHFQLLKLDVQGAELEVLSGGLATLKAAEVVLLEASFLQYNKGAPFFDEVVAFMKANGYVVFDILDCFRENKDLLFQGDILFIQEGSSLRPAGFYEYGKLSLH